MVEFLTKKIDNILDNIHDPIYFKREKHNIEKIIQGEAKNDSLDYLKSKLIEGKRYSVLKLIDKLNLNFDEDLFLNFFKYEENYNMNIYTLMFHLHVKNLISSTGIEKIKGVFMNNSNEKKDFLAEQMNSVETKVITKKIENDRSHFKKEKIQNFKATDKQDPYKNINKLAYDDLFDLKFINFKPKKVFVLDITDLFSLKEKSYFTDREKETIRWFNNEVLHITNRSFPYVKGIYIRSMSYERIFENLNTSSSHKQDILYDELKLYLNEYNYLKKNKIPFHRLDSLHRIDDWEFKKINDLIAKMKPSHKEKIVIYFITSKRLGRALSEILMFDFYCLNIEYLLSKADRRLSLLIDAIIEKEKVDYVTIFNSTEKDVRCFDGKNFIDDLENVLKKIT